MTKINFMRQLDKYLKDLEYDEKIEIYNYYEEYLTDMGIGSHDEIPNDMDPKKIAKEILLEYGINNIKKKKKHRSPWVLLFGIFGLILTLPLSLPIFILTFTIVGLVLFFVFGIGIVTLSVIFYLPFKFIGSFLRFGTFSISSSIGFLMFCTGFLIILYLIFKKFVHFVLSITSRYLGSFYQKKKYNKNSYNFNMIKKIQLNNIENCKIEIIKAKENNIEIKNLKNINVDYNLGSLKISSLKKFDELNEIKIFYSSNELEFKANNLDSDLILNCEKEGDIKIDNCNGNIQIITKSSDINLNSINSDNVLIDSKITENKFSNFTVNINNTDAYVNIGG